MTRLGETMDTSYNERNRASRERLRALVEGLSEADLALPLGDGAWTVGATLAHLAYYDTRVASTLETSVRHNLPRFWWNGEEANAVNEARTPGWRAMPGQEAVRQVLAAAEVVDAVVASLPPEVAAAVAQERPSALERAGHRAAHLDEIEQGLRAGTGS
jgi:uncharacterized damage-inducible protein DinB